MLNKVNKLFEAVSPLRLVQDLGFTIHTHKNGSYFIEDPKANKKPIFIKHYEFVSPDRFSPFKAGNIISFLSYLNNTPFEESLEQLFKSYNNRLTSPVFDSIQWSKGILCEYLEDLDLLLNLVHANKYKLLNEDKYSDCRSYMRHSCDDLNYISSLVSVTNEVELYDTLQKLKSIHGLKISAPNPTDPKNLILLPFFANYSTLTTLTVLNPQTKKTKDLDITNHDRGIFGLHALMPYDKCVYVVPDEDAVLSEVKSFFNHGFPNSYNCVSIKFKDETKNQSSGSFIPPALEKGLMVIDENTESSHILKTHGSFQELGLINKTQLFKVNFDQSRDARTHVLNQFMDMIAYGGLHNEKFEEFIEVLKEDPITLDRLRLQLKHTQRYEVLALLDSSTSKTEIQTINGNTIIVTRDGYVAQHKHRNVQFTNFTFKIHTTNIFKNSSDVYYSGFMQMGPHQIPFILSKRDSTRPGGVVSAAVYSLTSSGLVGDQSEFQTPALLDYTFSSALRNIALYEISNSVVKIGVNSLGWSENRSSYQGPTWSCVGSEIETSVPFYHPRIKIFNNFNWVDQNLERQQTTYNNTASNTVIALISSIIARSFLDMDTEPILVKNTKENRILLTSILKIFGQTKTEEINRNFRTEVFLQGINEYPIVCSCHNKNIMDNLRFPALVLASEGRTFNTADIDHAALSKFCNFYFPALINDIIRTKGSNLNPAYGNNEFSTLLSEGLDLMRQLLPDVSWYSTLNSWGVFGDWISSMSALDIKKAITLDFENQEMRIGLSFKGFKAKKNIGPKDLIAYFKQNNIEYRRPCGMYIYLNAEKALSMLSDIFVEVPELGTHKKEAPEKSGEQEESNDTRVG